MCHPYDAKDTIALESESVKHFFGESRPIRTEEKTTIHDDALMVVKMSTAQLMSANARTLLNELAFHARHANFGSTDPTTGREIAGVARLHAEMTQLSTIQLTLYTLQACPNAEASCQR